MTPDTTTVPIIVFNQIETGLSPDISALATVLVVVMVSVSVAGDAISRRRSGRGTTPLPSRRR